MLRQIEAWEYFGADQAAALVELRSQLGPGWATSPTDDVLLDVLARAVDLLHDATDLFFVQVDGVVELDGTGEPIIWLPYPVISEGQGGDGVTLIEVSGAEVDLDDVAVNEGARIGRGDPRWNPFIRRTRRSDSCYPCSHSSTARWPCGTRNIAVTASWGFVEPNGSTPRQIRRFLALVIAATTTPGSTGGVDVCDLGGGPIVAESVTDRSVTYASQAVALGLTLVREADLILRRYSRRAGISVSISRGRHT